MCYNWDVEAGEDSPTYNKTFLTMNNSAFDDGVLLFAVAAIALFEAIETLLSIPTKGFLKDPRIALQKKTVKQLRQMLSGIKQLSSKNKDQLIDLVLLHS